MKKLLTAAACITLFLATAHASFATPKKETGVKFRPSLLSKKGFWVIEQNPNNEKLVVVLYYNNQRDLVRKEIRTKRNADTRKAKVMRSLKRSLEEALDWAEPL